ncbi:MAG TPA: bacteriohemerythrin [Holophaga sp.]|nr:bacteriohemerythrin [Holophaga sp.]
MPIATWTSELETGHPMVDHQHQTLFGMINDLHHAIIGGHGPEQVGPVLKSLTRYTVQHFQTEESLMRTYAYPDFTEHKKAHDALVEKVETLVQRFDAGDTVMPSELSRFLADWLNHHIKSKDKLMIDWLKLTT